MQGEHVRLTIKRIVTTKSRLCSTNTLSPRAKVSERKSVTSFMDRESLDSKLLFSALFSVLLDISV